MRAGGGEGRGRGRGRRRRGKLREEECTYVVEREWDCLTYIYLYMCVLFVVHKVVVLQGERMRRDWRVMRS